MEKEHVVDLKQAYDDPTPFVTPSATPAIGFRRAECPCADADADAPPSCVVCRYTLLLSYFNCCAVCGNVIEPGKGSSSNQCRNRQQDNSYYYCYSYDPSRSATSLPPPATATTRAADDDDPEAENKGSCRRGRGSLCSRSRSGRSHCEARYCRYTHSRWLLALFAASECVPAGGAALLLSLGLARHDWALLRFGGLAAVQWWQIFVLPRLWHARRQILAGQLAACAFMVWFYVEGRREWPWWEPLFVSTVLLKIVFPW